MSATTGADLNDYALKELFQHLELKDRKNARLVCKQWNEVLSQIIFTKKEVLCIPAWCDFRSLTMILEKSIRSNFSLRFIEHEIDCNYDSRHFWITVGNRIESLSFDCCEFTGKSVTDIFSLCVNLKEFSDFCSCYYYIEGGNFLPSEFNFVRENLQKLSLRSSKSWLWQENNLFIIAKVFPNLKILRCNIEFPKVLGTNKMKMLQLNTLADQLKSIEILELDSKMPVSGSFTINENFQLAPTLNWTRLQNIRMVLNSYIMHTEPLENILSHQLWTSLYLHEIDLPPSIDVTIIVRLLTELPLLENFQLGRESRFGEFRLNEDSFRILFPALVKSRLKTVLIKFQWHKDNWRTMSQTVWDETFVNLTVQQLEIDIFQCTDKTYYSAFCSHFIKHFLGLTKLRLLSDKAFDPSFIFKYQRKLEYLRFDRIKGTQIGIESPLTHLISLEGQSSYDYWNMFFTYQFPNLQYLHIYCVCELETDQNDFTESVKFLLRAISANCPNLQGFSITLSGQRQVSQEYVSVGLKLSEILQLCQQFHCLRYLLLCFNHADDEDDEILKHALFTHFQQCSSLLRVRIRLTHKDIHAFLETISREFIYSTSIKQPKSIDAHWRRYIRWLDSSCIDA